MGRAAHAGISVNLLVGEFGCDVGGFGLGLLDEFVLQSLKACGVLRLLQLLDLSVVLGHQTTEDILLLHVGHALGHHVELVAAVDLAGDDVELAAAAAALGVDLVAGAGSCQRSTLVEILGINKLGLDGVAGVAVAKGGLGTGILRVAVTRLDHEVLDHAVKEHTVVVALLDELDEVVAVLGCLVVKLDDDVAQRCLEFNFCHFVIGFCLFGCAGCTLGVACRARHERERNHHDGKKEIPLHFYCY